MASKCRSRARNNPSDSPCQPTCCNICCRSPSSPVPCFADTRTVWIPSSSVTAAFSPDKSILLCTNKRGSVGGSLARIACSASPKPCAASTNNKARSARVMACHVRSIPICSTLSSVSRKPAVSMICSGTPSKTMCSRTVSRVVPAMSVTMAISSPAKALSKLDLPTFGCPINTTCNPSRNIAPCVAVAKTRSSCCCTCCKRAKAPAFSSHSTSSSSGKSKVASVNIRN